MDGTASESVHPPSQSTAPSSRRFSASRVADAIEKLLIFWSRLAEYERVASEAVNCDRSIKRELDISGVDEQLAALRGVREIGPETMLAVVPKPSLYSFRDLLKESPQALKGLGKLRDLTYGCVGPKSLSIIDERTKAFYRYAERVRGSVLVVPLEVRQTRMSDDDLRNVMVDFRRGECYIDPYTFGFALLSGQLSGWRGTVRFPAIDAIPFGRFRKSIPIWSRTDDEYRFQVREISFASSSEPYVVGSAPEEYLSCD